MIYLTIKVIFLKFNIQKPLFNYLNGILMLTVVSRIFRLIKELRNSTILSYFRVLLNILGKVIVQLFPLLLLIFFVMVFSSILAINTMNGKF
jgi:hypothetical protein